METVHQHPLQQEYGGRIVGGGSSRRIRHIPAWVDEQLRMTVEGDGPTTMTTAEKTAMTSHRTRYRKLDVNAGGANDNIGRGGDESNIAVRHLLATAHAIPPVRRQQSLESTPPPAAPQLEVQQGGPASSIISPAEAATIALHHSLARADDALYYNGSTAHHPSESTAVPGGAPPVVGGIYRCATDPMDAVSTYNIRCRTTLADVQDVFRSSSHGRNGTGHREGEGTAKHPAHNVNDDPEQQQQSRRTTDGGGGLAQQSCQPSLPSSSPPDSSSSLSVQDLMIQLAARGAVSDTALKEFLAFRPQAWNALVYPTYSSRSDGGYRRTEAAILPQSNPTTTTVHKLQVVLQPQQRLTSSTQQPSTSVKTTTTTTSVRRVDPTALGSSSIAPPTATGRCGGSDVRGRHDVTQPTTTATSIGAAAVVVPLLSRRKTNVVPSSTSAVVSSSTTTSVTASSKASSVTILGRPQSRAAVPVGGGAPQHVRLAPSMAVSRDVGDENDLISPPPLPPAIAHVNSRRVEIFGSSGSQVTTKASAMQRQGGGGTASVVVPLMVVSTPGGGISENYYGDHRSLPDTRFSWMHGDKQHQPSSTASTVSAARRANQGQYVKAFAELEDEYMKQVLP